jgi:O6-methylguanine-DNA--protein-cysteine methyltransferase
VGVALAGNPFSVVVDCHRVLAAHGKLRGFSAHREPSRSVSVSPEENESRFHFW